MSISPDLALAMHCGPALLGRKSAALLSLPHSQLSHAAQILAASASGPCCRILRRGERTALVLVYQERLLRAALEAPVPRASLERLGYPVAGGVDAMVTGLARRIARQGAFPHEVGFFLGYPQRDVLGFMRHQGRGCKYSGQWKVYGDVSQAQALFTRYARCSAYLLARVRRDGSLLPALGAVPVS